MRIVSFNVNGIRAIRDFYATCNHWTFTQFLDSFNADIICMQETKCNQASGLTPDIQMPHDWHAYWLHHPPHSTSNKQGYSGVVTFVKQGPWIPVAWEEGVTGCLGVRKGPEIGGLLSDPVEQLRWLDSEARCLITDHVHFVLLNVYYPNEGRNPEFRQLFYDVVRKRIENLIQVERRSVVLVGDLNATPFPRDHCDYFRHCQKLSEQEIHDAMSGNPNEHEILTLFYSERQDRRWIGNLLNLMTDSFRLYHPQREEAFTCWNQKVGARANNIGTRLDYILVGGGPIVSCLRGAEIEPNIMGSDHCPVWADFDLDPIPDIEPALPSTHSQTRLSQFFTLKRKTTDDEGRKTKDDDPKASSNEQRKVQGTLKRRPEVPKCKGHGETCALKRVTKGGPNQGREFYTCARPIGHPGDPAGQCSHFEWL